MYFVLQIDDASRDLLNFCKFIFYNLTRKLGTDYQNVKYGSFDFGPFSLRVDDLRIAQETLGQRTRPAVRVVACLESERNQRVEWGRSCGDTAAVGLTNVVGSVLGCISRKIQVVCKVNRPELDDICLFLCSRICIHSSFSMIYQCISLHADDKRMQCSGIRSASFEKLGRLEENLLFGPFSVVKGDFFTNQRERLIHQIFVFATNVFNKRFKS